MKKVIYHQHGNLDVLQLAEVGKPRIEDHTILVKVKAVSINPLDWKVVKGSMRPMSGFSFPKGIGIDFSGIVEEVGKTIKTFKKGDEVFGLLDVFKGGALAEYLTVSEKEIAWKPSSLSFEQAAALPVTGSAALQILNNLIKVKQGSEVLINGATGGIGMFLVQFAKQRGAVVTSVVSSRGLELAKKWKSDFIIDYRSHNILLQKKKYDAVIDLSGRLPFKMAKAIMKNSAVYVNTTPGLREIIASALNNLFSSKKYQLLFLKPSADLLAAIADKSTKGIDIVIDKVWNLSAFREAYESAMNEGSLGKKVIRME